jgi:hypothetical protein
MTDLRKQALKLCEDVIDFFASGCAAGADFAVDWHDAVVICGLLDVPSGA